MPATRRQARRIGTARATVVTLHALLLAAVLREQVVPRDVAPIAADERLEILWLPAVTRAPPPQRLRTPVSPPPARRLALAPPGAPGAPAAIAAPPESPSPVDWAREAERVARAAPRTEAAPRTDCEDTDRPGAMRPRCTPRRPGFGWGREPRAVEFSGGLPFVRLGKRCVLGLGFFACAVGTLPEANGHLFDDRGNPDRPRSSVPETPDAAQP